MKNSDKIKEKILMRGAEAIKLVNEAKALQKELGHRARTFGKVQDSIDRLELAYIDALDDEGSSVVVEGSFTEGMSEAEVFISAHFDAVRTYSTRPHEQALAFSWNLF